MTREWPDLAVLELLVAVAERGSVGEAARAVEMTQPAASRSLSRLERRLGVPLLVRTPRGSTLTAAGAVLVDYARAALEAAEHLVLGARALRAGARDTLRVAASMTVAEHLVPAWLSRLRRAHPDLRVALEVRNSGQVLEELRAGQLDVGFVETPQVPRDLVSTLVGTDRLEVVAHPDHPWARRRRPLGAAELAATPLVVREAGSGTRTTLAAALDGHRLAEPAMEVSSNAAVRASVEAGVAPAVLSHLAVGDALRTGALRAVPVDGLDLHRPLHAAWRPPRRLQGPAADLVRLARDHPR